MSLSRVWPVNTFIFQTFLRGRPFDFWSGYGLFQKKNAERFWGGGKSSKEIPGEEISCTETKKYLSWCIMLEKKILYTIIPRGKNSITRGLGKNSYPATYKSPISHLKSKMVNPFLSFLSSRKILSLPFLLSAWNFLKIHNEWSQIHFKFAYFSFFLTALFTNKRTLKLESHLHNCIFLCRQSKHRNTQNGSKFTNQTQTMTFWTRVFIVKLCFLRGPLRWLTAVKNTNFSWLLNFSVCMFLKSAIITWNWNNKYVYTLPSFSQKPTPFADKMSKVYTLLSLSNAYAFGH